jgi:thioredoxin 1
MTAEGAHNDVVQEITDDNFEEQVLGAAAPFLLDLSAEWCQPCKAIAPVVSALAAEYAGRISFGTIDIDKNPRVPTQFQVRSIPTLLLFNGGKVVGQLTGAHPRSRIEDLLKKAL